VILYKYVLKKCIYYTCLVLFLAIFLFVIFDLIHKSTGYFDTFKPSLITILKYYLAQIPYQIFLFLPIASLLSSIFVVLQIHRTGEISAMRAIGMNISQICLPFLSNGFFLAFLSIFLTEAVIPRSAQYLYYIKKNLIEAGPSTEEKQRFLTWAKYENYVFHFSDYDSVLKIIKEIEFIELSESFIPIKRLSGSQVEYLQDKKKWLLTDWVENTLNPDTGAILSSLKGKNKLIHLPILPQKMTVEERRPEELSLYEIKSFIQRSRSYGGDILPFLVAWHTRLAYFLSAILMSLIGIPFGFKPERNHENIQNIIFAFFFGFSYWFILSSCRAIALSGNLDPKFAAWIGNIFMIVTLHLQFRKLKTI
jgi:lipopolysaccharide export system permease protein